MSDNKISLSDAERRTLREIARRKAADLSAAEETLGDDKEASFHQRAKQVKETLTNAMAHKFHKEGDLDKNLESNWNAIQLRIARAHAASPQEEKPARPKRRVPWIGLSGFVAAAALLIVIIQRQPTELVTVDGGAAKGTDSLVYGVQCDFSLVPEQGEARLQDDGKTFLVPIGTPIHLKGSCRQKVNMHISIQKNAQREVIMNADVGNEARFITRPGSTQPWSLAPTQPGPGYVVLYATSSRLPSDTTLPLSPFAEKIGGESVLWSDDITFVAK